mgnify:CR=1 FL=1
MAKTKTTLKVGDNLPARGMSNKNRVLEGILASSKSGLRKGATRDEAEIAYFKHVSERAFDSEDKDSGTLLKFLGDKAYSSMKPTLGCVEFAFDSESAPSAQASQVLLAASKGEIAPDIAGTFISSIANMLKIDEVSTLRDEVDEIKAILKAQANG